MPLIGTAGHVDHGKSTLIECLTGRDPDRWAEEKKRGLTIDLGFAWKSFDDGTEVSFVDVPGHERFLKNMLAGIEAIDVALLVVAADEGWMPQSEEHLAVLDLLEVSHGVVALTKADIVDADLLELAQIEASENLEGTTLAESVVVPVSAVSGFGIEALVAELSRQVAMVTPRNVSRPRLWVDRSFSASGSGTVATGTLLDGPFAIDDEVEIYPKGGAARIRGIQSHEATLSTVTPGRRVALNLAGPNREDVVRGNMIGAPGQWATSDRFLVSLRTARYVDGIDKRGAYQLHIGSAVRQVRVISIVDGAAVLVADTPIPMAVGDRFIIRDTGRQLVVGGGRILDPQPGSSTTALETAVRLDPDAPRDVIAGALLSIRGVEDRRLLEIQTGGGVPPKAMRIGDQLFTEQVFGDLTDAAVDAVDREHEEHPLRVGIPLATLAERLQVTVGTLETLVDQTPDLERRGPDITRVGRQIALDRGAVEAWDRARTSLSAGLAVPTISDLGLDPEVLHLKIRQGELVRISEDFVFLPEQVERITGSLRGFDGDFTVADFRDALGLSRKYAVPILEWADKEGLTVRRGDTRRVR